MNFGIDCNVYNSIQDAINFFLNSGSREENVKHVSLNALHGSFSFSKLDERKVVGETTSEDIGLVVVCGSGVDRGGLLQGSSD